MKRLLAVTAALIFAFALTSFAQDEDLEYVESDVAEVNFYGGGNFPTGDIKSYSDSLGAKMGWNVGLDIGWFARYNMTLGLNFNYTEFGIDNNDTDEAAEGLKHRIYNPNLYVKYYFSGESYWEPYVKAQVGLDFPKFTTFVQNPAGDRYRQLSFDPALSAGIGAGLFYYTADYGGLYVEANYHYAWTEDAEADYEGQIYQYGYNISTFEIHLGVRILIGSGS